MSGRQPRFSWQAPLAGETPAYQEQRPQQPHQIATHQPRASTRRASQRHFSYAPTPNELRAFVYIPSPNDPPLPPVVPASFATSPYAPIHPSTQSLPGPQVPAIHLQPPNPPAPPAYVRDEKSLVSPVSPCDGNHALSISPVSPIPQQQPFQRPTGSANKHTRQMSGLSRINTNFNKHPTLPIPAMSPFRDPLQTPVSAGSMNKNQLRNGPVSPKSNLSPMYEPYSPHGFLSKQTRNSHAIFTPDSAHGPNGMDFSLHQPGQIAHPNMDSENPSQWTHSLCACSGDVSTCLTGLVCPCLVYGQTSYRLSQKSAKKDPTDMLGYTSANGHCMLMSFVCGLWCLFPMLQRTRIRHMYKLDGSMGSDCLKGSVCCCCVAIQNEREVKNREESSRKRAGPAQGGYSRASAMMYKPQQ